MCTDSSTVRYALVISWCFVIRIENEKLRNQLMTLIFQLASSSNFARVLSFALLIIDGLRRRRSKQREELVRSSCSSNCPHLLHRTSESLHAIGQSTQLE